MSQSEGRSQELLTIHDLHVSFAGRGWRAPRVEVLHGINLGVRRAETVGLVGESGSGKTTVGRAVLGLVPVEGGSIRFDDNEISRLGRRERRALARDLQVVFQDPFTSLNPSLTVGSILAEPLVAAGTDRSRASARVAELLDAVKLPKDSVGRLPREFSGGQRQRVAIARAMAIGPRLIICDEPVSALDLSTQQAVLDLFIEMQERTGVSYLFISHDLNVVRYLSHRVAVIQSGHIVEAGDAAQVTSSPTQDYTRRLLLSSPVTDPDEQSRRRAALEEARAAT
ncbi:ABC transporter ATP-binding protein [Branchiibius cervicis]|uniref:ABC transporter ATP-binding protein n=1 Tax=Branchiibius cervicis TaxID=908252 RepID=A0ABW2AWA7_9MICO